MKILLLAIFLCASVALPCADWAQERGQGTRPVNRPLVAGQYHALLIGVADYADPKVNDLDYPLRDVARVKQVLTADYSFAAANVTTLTNPTRERLVGELEQLAERLSADDHLLVFYAGHGYWDEARRQGYWLPSDARRASKTNWISNGELRDAIRAVRARHTLLISDACFSGSMFVTRDAFVREAALAEVDKLPSRTAMTSGALTTVPDRSVFVQYLLDRLEKNAAPYVFAQDLFTQLRQPVINNSKPQTDGSLATPRYGVIQETGDEGGDFIFLRKTGLAVANATVDPAALELALWQSADRSNEISEFEEYLRQYPNGLFAVSARNRITKLRALAGTPSGTKPTSTGRISVTGVPLRAFNFETVIVDGLGEVKTRQQGVAFGFTEDINGVPLEMVELVGGTFTMGSPIIEKERGEDEVRHQVTVGGLMMGKYEITQAQWRAAAKLPKVKMDLPPDPANFKGGTLPVENVSWEEAVEFCARLSRKTGRHYGLPTEAEWEYAARAGVQTPFAFGETITPVLVNYDGNYPYGGATIGERRRKTVLVGSLKVANAFGLYDLHGNVWEWCHDWYGPYIAQQQNNPTGPSSAGEGRVLRGGSWLVSGWYCRAALRGWNTPGGRSDSIGFRVAMAPKIQ